MGYRPHPNRDRALKQIDRHIDEVGPALPPRPMTALEGKLLARAQMAGAAAGAALAAALKLGQPSGSELVAAVDTYRLSTRPGVVSGGS
ncbi:hypothetical protein [Streptomyces reticuli]|uniref:hypothetical protein n=1 Tax=Streptomyces reticuli TaxID=1926 RepID=UPI00073DF7AF|nr:hypothetical protein [Streptomyces sp. SID7810]CUW31808.1 hypothetical protein TUE45_06557 [Streptomyces reticuli]